MYPVTITSIVMLLLGSIPLFLMPDNFIRLIICVAMTTCGMIVSLCSFGITSEEKLIMKNLRHNISSKLIKRPNQ